MFLDISFFMRFFCLNVLLLCLLFVFQPTNIVCTNLNFFSLSFASLLDKLLQHCLCSVIQPKYSVLVWELLKHLLNVTSLLLGTQSENLEQQIGNRNFGEFKTLIVVGNLFSMKSYTDSSIIVRVLIHLIPLPQRRIWRGINELSSKMNDDD